MHTTATALGLADQVAAPAAAAIAFDHVALAFDEQVVLRDLSFSVPTGSTRILLGGSGAGKSLILKLILGLLQPDAGTITVNGEHVDHMSERELLRVRANIGILFQENALFDSLTVAENVGYRLIEDRIAPAAVRSRVDEVLTFVGLADFGDRMPATLSGGQRRRVAIARAMAPNPAVLLFDDPTSGLDPIIATTVDDEIIKLRDLQKVTSIIVTHQIRDAFYIATHEAIRQDGKIQIVPASAAKATATEFFFLHDGRIHFHGSPTELLASHDPHLEAFLYRTLPPW